MADGETPIQVAQNAGWLTPVLSAGGAVIGAALLWLGQRMIGKAAWQGALNDGFAKFTAQLRDELADERAERKSLRDTLDRERLETAGERAALRGEIANLIQVIEGLKERLRNAGIAIPEVRPAASIENPPPKAMELGDQLSPRRNAP